MCVIDEEHTDAISSGQRLQQDHKLQMKVCLRKRELFITLLFHPFSLYVIIMMMVKIRLLIIVVTCVENVIVCYIITNVLITMNDK